MSELTTQYKNLKAEVEKHSHLYYVKNEPIISDREFDSLFDELLDFEKEHPELAADDSPTKRVGGRSLVKSSKLLINSLALPPGLRRSRLSGNAGNGMKHKAVVRLFSTITSLKSRWP